MLKNVTDSTFTPEVIQAKEPYLLVFSASWCPTCQRWAPELERLSEELLGKASVGVVDVDTEEGLTRDHSIRSVPHAFLYHKGKQAVRYAPGPVESDRIKADVAALRRGAVGSSIS